MQTAMLSSCLETLGVLALAAIGVWVGRWAAKGRPLLWSLAYLLALALLALIASSQRTGAAAASWCGGRANGTVSRLPIPPSPCYKPGMRPSTQPPLGIRLGLSMHVSPLRFRLTDLARRFPSTDAGSFEDWLLDVANARGARIVVRDHATNVRFVPPPVDAMNNEELVVAICQLQGADRPQLLRLAAQLISGDAVNVPALIRLAIRERAGSVLGAMAREALRVSEHPAWRALAEAFATAPRPRDVVIHWTRLAQPVMNAGRCNAASWRLVA